MGHANCTATITSICKPSGRWFWNLWPWNWCRLHC